MKQIAKSIIVQVMLSIGAFTLIIIGMLTYSFFVTTGDALLIFLFCIFVVPMLFAATCVGITLIGLYRMMNAYEQLRVAKDNVIEKAPK